MGYCHDATAANFSHHSRIYKPKSKLKRMRESNESEKLDVCINKIKFINTCIISVFKAKGVTMDNKETDKSINEWKMQIKKSKELLERFFKEYLPNSR